MFVTCFSALCRGMCCLWLVAQLWPAAVYANPAHLLHVAIDIAEGVAVDTLPILARQSGIELIYRSDAVAGTLTRAVHGRLTPHAALSQMLEGTRLTAVLDSESGAYAVVPNAGAPASAHPPQPGGTHHKTTPDSDSTAQMKNPNPLFRSIKNTLMAAGIIYGPATHAQTNAPGSAAGEEEVVVLSPFTVSADRDQGYTATQSLAGGRLATQLKDSGAAVTVLTREFLDDIAANNFLDAADWAPNSNSVYSATGPQIFNDYQVNFRSLGAGFQSRNYFRWYVNSDVYNTSRIDFARGPNSVVFGDAGVGGIANVSSKRAVNASTNEISMRWNSFDGYRASIDANRALTDKLFVRVAAVYDESDDWVDAQSSKREGVFLAGTYRIGPKTELRGEIELGTVDRVVGFFPFDNYSAWDGVTNVSAPRTSGNFTGGISRYTADSLTYIPGMPDLGIVNWRNWGRSSGSTRQLLTTPMELSPLGAPTIDRLSLSFQSPEAAVEQPFKVGAFFLEHQVGEKLFLELAGNNQIAERDVIQHFAQSITVDVNQFLPNGQPNPNLGKRFTDDRRRNQFQSNETYEYRASAAYLLENDWMKQRLLLSAGQRWERFELDEYENVRTNGTDLRLNQAANRILTRRYEDRLSAGVGMPSTMNDPSGIQTKFARLNGTYTESELTYAQVAASGSWLKSQRLKTIAAVRKDYLAGARAAIVRDPVTQEWVSYTPEVDDPDVDVTTLTGGAVVEITKSINAFVNYAESFQPATFALGIDGRSIPPLESEGMDVGIKVSLFEDRLVGSIGYYWNEEMNRRTGGSSNNINTIWDDLLSSNEVQVGYSDTFSLKGQGVEFDFTANITSSWRLMFNLALPQTEQIDGYAATRAYYAANIDEWRAGAAAQTDPAIATRISNNILSIENNIASFAQGRELNGSYDYTANLYTNYTFKGGALDGLGIGGGVQMRGDRLVTSLPGSPFDYLYVDEYYLVTASLSYRLKVFEKPLRLQLNISNLLDDELIQPTRYNTYTVSGTTAYVPDRYYIQPPRRFTLTATYQF